MFLIQSRIINRAFQIKFKAVQVHCVEGVAEWMRGYMIFNDAN